MNEAVEKMKEIVESKYNDDFDEAYFAGEIANALYDAISKGEIPGVRIDG